MNRSRIAVAGLAAIALVLGGLIYHDIFVPTKNTGSTVSLYTVTRRSVTASITGTGNLVPMAQANVNFHVSGILTEIDVHVGDHVTAGQVLARVDPTTEQQALAAAQANLQVAQANLQVVETPLTGSQIQQLQNALAIAQQSYNDTVTQVNFTNTQDANQVAADRSQLTTDQNSLTFNPTYQTAQQKLTTDQATLNADIATFNANCSNQTYPYSGACVTYYATVGTDQTTVNTDELALNTCCSAAISAVNADKTKLNQDLAKQQTDAISGQHSINAAAAAVTSAHDNLVTQTESKPNQIASAQAQLTSAQTAVQTAQENLAATTLAAPMNGTINGINGVVGESVGPGSGSTAEAPGTQAPLPTTTPSSSFMVIGNDSGMEVVVPFAESDAARVASNQDASITFDAVPSVSITGKVLAVASSATISSGVVNYYATISLDQGNPALKEGMTSNATVVVSSATNVLTVPNLAITRLGGQAYVTLYANGQETQTAIETGVIGDTYTEVTSGLTEGQQIVLPTLRVPSGTNTRGGANPIRIGGGG